MTLRPTRLCAVSEVDQPPSEEQLMRQRLSVLDAYLRAVEHRGEVMDAVAEAPDREQARRSVAHLLGIAENAASAVLDLRLRSFSQSDVAGARSESERIRDLQDRAH
jgi:DNA gyrase/topoisomerase IV subunit A